MEYLTLISKDNWIPIQNRNNRKNKRRKFYDWKLDRFYMKAKPEIQIFDNYALMDVTPFIPSGILQNLKEEFLAEINSRQIFDFDYQPVEFDFLTINNPKVIDDWLHLIFINDSWIEHHWYEKIRNPKDTYLEFKSGFWELG